ncbi:unnamed protein product, partial [Candidula unifasciata]
MKLRNSIFCILQIILSCHVSSTTSFSSFKGPASALGSTKADSVHQICRSVEVKQCSKMYNSTFVKNSNEVASWKETNRKVNTILNSFSQNSRAIIAFVCTLYLPPCVDKNSDFGGTEGSKVNILSQPCRQMCQLATEEGQRLLTSGAQLWPGQCQTLPTENCINLIGANKILFVEQSISAVPSKTLQKSIPEFAPLDVELGKDDGFEVEVISYSNKRIPERRYDIANFGDPSLFQGWADVQATGAANDYCRVVGKLKRRFLSCNLAGSTGQGHHYVSRLGFDPGYHHTWFMRDMDGDGRDDYC